MQHELFDYIRDIQGSDQGEAELLNGGTRDTIGSEDRHTETGPRGNRVDPLAKQREFPANVSHEGWGGINMVEGLVQLVKVPIAERAYGGGYFTLSTHAEGVEGTEKGINLVTNG